MSTFCTKSHEQTRFPLVLPGSIPAGSPRAGGDPTKRCVTRVRTGDLPKRRRTAPMHLCAHGTQIEGGESM
jgi:hypothetical protein